MAKYRVGHIAWIPSYPAKLAAPVLAVMAGIAPADYNVSTRMADVPFSDVVTPVIIYGQEADAVLLERPVSKAPRWHPEDAMQLFL